MAKRKKRVQQAEIVQLFAARLRELRSSRGMTQLELAERARITVSYVWRLESGGTGPGVDLVDRLAQALGTTVADLLPTAVSPETMTVLQDQAKRLFNRLLNAADKETLLMLNPLLARLADSVARSR